MFDDDDNPDRCTDLAHLWEVTKEQLDDLDGDSPDPVKTGQIATEFASNLAEAVHFGDATDTESDPLLKQFARLANMKKSAVENQFESAKQNLEAEDNAREAKSKDGDDDVLERSITFLLEHMLDELVIYEPTDASVKIRYNWRFNNGVEVETETEHLGPDSFCQCYHDASGGRLNATMPDNFEGSWTEYIRGFVSELRDEDHRVQVIPVEGLRTQAVDDLKETIEQKPATTNQRAATTQKRAYVETIDADVVQVPSGVVERILANFDDVTYNDIQIELDKRGHRAGNVRATQVGDGRGGTNVRFWQLNRQWLDIEVEPPQDEQGDEGGDDV